MVHFHYVLFGKTPMNIIFYYYSLIFSSFVMVLDVVEYFMSQINEIGINRKIGAFAFCEFSDIRYIYNFVTDPGMESFRGPWKVGQDYYRLDGRTPKIIRHQMITNFNSPSNMTSVFLISGKAGGQGINLTGANRVILLDTSWNPSNDRKNCK